MRAVKRIVGVKAIADDLEVKLMNPMNHTDGDIAASAAMHIDSWVVPLWVVPLCKGWREF